MKLHLPKPLRNSVLACIAAVAGIVTSTLGTASFAGGVVAFTLASQQAMADVTISDTQTWDTDAEGDLGLISVAGGAASLTISGGTHTSTGKMELKNGSGVIMTGGELTINQMLLHNQWTNTQETFRLSGGTLNVTSSELGINTRATVLIGHWPGTNSFGKLLVEEDGVLNVLNGGVVVGWDSKGIFEVAGGTVNARQIHLKNESSELTVSGGELNILAGGTISGSGSFVYSGGTLTLGEGATINTALTLSGNAALVTESTTSVFGENFSLNLADCVSTTGADGSVVYTVLTGTGNKDLSALTTESITGVPTAGRTWTFGADGIISYKVTSKDVVWSEGASLSWGATGSTFTTGGEFANGDSVTFAASADVAIATGGVEAMQVTIEGEGTYVKFTGGQAVSLEKGLTVGKGATLELVNNVDYGSTGLLRGEVTVQDGGKLIFIAKDMTGWNSNCTETINILSGGTLELHHGALNNNETFRGVLNLDGTMEGKNGAARWDLFGGNAAINVASGANAVMDNVSLCIRQANGVVTVGNDGTLTITNGVVKAAGETHAAILVKQGAGALIVQGESTNGGFTVNGGSVEITNESERTMTISGVAGTSFTKNGAGIINMGNIKNYSYAGEMIVNDGEIKFTSDADEQPAVQPGFASLYAGLVTTEDTKAVVEGDVSINYKNQAAQACTPTLRGNLEVTGNVSLNSRDSGNSPDGDRMRRWGIDSNGALSVGGTLWLTNMQKMVVSGGDLVAAGGIILGHGDNGANGAYKAKLQLDSGSVTTSGIEFKGGYNSVVMNGGTLELTGTAGIASAIDTTITGGTLVAKEASWGITGATIGGATVAEDGTLNCAVQIQTTGGNTITLTNATILGTLDNAAGKLVLGGTIDITSSGYQSVTTTMEYSSSTGNGYARTNTVYSLVTTAENLSIAENTQWTVDGSSSNASYSNGVVSVAGADWGTEYYLCKAAEAYSSISKVNGENEALTALVLAGSGLNLNANLGSVTIRVEKEGQSVVDVASGCTLSASQVTGTDATHQLKLHGSGTYALTSGTATLGDGTVLGRDWTGTVKVTNATRLTYFNVDSLAAFTEEGAARSTVELTGVTGHLTAPNVTYKANLKLTDDGMTKALTLTNGWKANVTTFAGTISGNGSFVIGAGVPSGATYAFTGDLSSWEGEFVQNGGATVNLTIAGTGNVGIDILRKLGTMNVTFSGNGTILKGNIGGEAATNTAKTTVTITEGASVTMDGSVLTKTLTNAGTLIVNGTLADGAAVTNNGMLKLMQDAASLASLTLGANVTSMDVGGTLSVGAIEMLGLSAAAPVLTVGQFAAGETVFLLDVEMLNALNLGHGESVTIARADQIISGDFSAWLGSTGSTSLDAAVYRYDISVENTDVVVTLDYANWGTRMWYGNTWVGNEDWARYAVSGYDAVDGVETVDLAGGSIVAPELYIAPGSSTATTVLRNGTCVTDITEVVDGRLQIAAGGTLEAYDLRAVGQEINLQGTMKLTNAAIGSLTGTTGSLSISASGTVVVDSDVTLGSLQNSGTLNIGKNKLNVAGAVTTGGNVFAGEVVVHNSMRNAAVFDALVADKVTVTNSFSSYEDAISLGDGSAVGELYTEKLEVRKGTVMLGYADKATQQTVHNLALQKDATLALNKQTELSVSNSLTAAEGATVQLEQDAALNYQRLSISNKHEDKKISVNAAQLAANSSELVLQDAYVKTSGSTTYELGYQLVNSTVENAGSGTLQLTNGSNELSGVLAGGGNVEVFNATSGMTMETLLVEAGLSVSVMVGASGTTSANAEVVVSGNTLLSGTSTLHADLTMADGATLDMVGLDAGAVLLNGSLTFSGQVTIGESLLTLLEDIKVQTEGMVLFTGIDSLTLPDMVTTTASARLWAGSVFSNLPGQNYYLDYKADAGSLSLVYAVPEPATATLSLLALAALASRRRRK